MAINRVPPPPNAASPAAAAINRRCFGAAYLLVAALALHQLSSALLPGARAGWRAGAGLGVALTLLVALGWVAVMGGEGPYHLHGRESPAPSRAATLDSETTGLLDSSAAGAEEGAPDPPGSGRVLSRSTSSTKLAPLAVELPVSVPASGGPSLSRSGSTVGSPRGKHRLAVATNPWQQPEEVKGYASSSSGGGSLGDCYRSEPFWLLFGVFAVGVGSGLAFSNNLAEVVGALAPLGPTAGGGGGGSSGSTPGSGAGVALVSLFSVGSCCGR